MKSIKKAIFTLEEKKRMINELEEKLGRKGWEDEEWGKLTKYKKSLEEMEKKVDKWNDALRKKGNEQTA